MRRALAVAAPSQHDCIERILRDAFTPYAEAVGYELGAEAYEWLHPAIADGRVYVGIEDGEIVGVVATRHHGGALEIDYLATDPARQGAGIGGWLVTAIAALARGEGLGALVLHTAEIREDLLRFYRRHGFAETGRAPPAHGKDSHLRVHLRKDL